MTEDDQRKSPEEPEKQTGQAEATKRDEYFRELERYKTVSSPSLQKYAHQILKTDRAIHDFNAIVIPVAEGLKTEHRVPDTYFDAPANSLRAINDVAGQITGNMTLVDTFVATAAGNTSAGVTFMSGLQSQHLPPDMISVVVVASEKIHRWLERQPLVEQIQANLNRLNMFKPVLFRKQRPGDPISKKTPAELLQAAQASLDVPSAGESAPLPVLVHLRGSIEEAVDILIRRRPTQSPIHGGGTLLAKVEAIGHQLARPGLANGLFSTLGQTLADLLKKYSESKTNNMAREQIVDSYHLGLIHYLTLLVSVDETLLK